MSNFELFYLVIGPIALPAGGTFLFFGGRWLIALGDQRGPQRTWKVCR